MSPTTLRLLRTYERQIRRWQRGEHAYWRQHGMPASARYYSARGRWPDALSMARDTMYWIEGAA